MIKIKDRIKAIRKQAKETQQIFGERIGLSRNYIAMIELGERVPSDRTIKDICRIYQINEYWLKTGEGKMHDDYSLAEDIMHFAMEVIGGSPNSTQATFIKALSKLTPAEWEVVQKIIDSLAEKETGPDESDPE